MLTLKGRPSTFPYFSCSHSKGETFYSSLLLLFSLQRANLIYCSLLLLLSFKRVDLAFTTTLFSFILFSIPISLVQQQAQVTLIDSPPLTTNHHAHEVPHLNNCPYHQLMILLDALPSPGVNPLEGSPMWSCGIGTRKGAPDFQHYKGVEGCARSPGIRLGRRTSRSSLILHPKQTTKWLVYIQEHPWVLGQATATLDHKTYHDPDSGEATTFHIAFSAPHFGDYIQMALFPGTLKLESRNCPEIVPVGVPGL